MKYKNKISAGTTLIELIMYSGLLVFAISTLYYFYTQVVFQKSRQLAQSSLGINANKILTDLLQTINQASNVTTPALHQSTNNLILNTGTITYQLNPEYELIKIESGETNKL